MSWLERAIASDKRKAQWNVLDNVPDEFLVEGCGYCYRGWAEGPGLVYSCQCNPYEGEYRA